MSEFVICGRVEYKENWTFTTHAPSPRQAMLDFMQANEEEVEDSCASCLYIDCFIEMKPGLYRMIYHDTLYPDEPIGEIKSGEWRQVPLVWKSKEVA